MFITKSETREYEVEVPKTLEGFRKWEFSSGGMTGEDFKVFARLFKKEIERQLPSGVQLIQFNKGHYDCSGFVSRDSRYAYFSISDVRYFSQGWHNNILVRTAKSDKDYTGGSNGYTRLDNFGKAVEALLERR